ncbi:MAG: PD40 domain-containing protein, partial [Phaeodactylibacter sp.]|nr:PD40 domain-containing protein [Phaeodactylibacter sp.]
QAPAGEYIDATWKLAQVKKQLGDYDAAAEAYREFATLTPDADWAGKSLEEAEACSWAQEIINNPTKGLKVDTLGATINTPYSEYYPIPYEDELYYTSLSYFPEEDIHDPVRPVMKVMKSLSLKPGDLMPDLNDDTLHTAYMTFNTNYSRVYYCLCSYRAFADIQCELYYRDIMEDAALGAPVKLPDNINVIGSTNSQPNIGFDKEADRELLFYVSDRDEGKGGMDIWCSIIDKKGGFSAPFPVADINTEEDDATPFFHQESQNLYFASQGHKGLGGFDLFRAEKDGDGYLEPENLGYPTNSSFNDISIYLSSDETSGFLASNRQGSVTFDGIREYCCYDIFGFQQTVARLKIELFACDREQDVPVYNADLALYEVDENGVERFMEKLKSETNIYTKVVQRNKTYRVQAMEEGYESAEYVFDLTRPN